MDLHHLPYPSRRSPVIAKNGIVCSSQPLAAQAGLDMLKAGGSAVDAAIATAAMLTVVEPSQNGIGGDAFAIVWDSERLRGYNGSGRAPAGLTEERVRASGYTVMPQRGWLTVTVPGTPRAWADLHTKYGRLDFQQVLAPAIATAREGYAVTPVVSRIWAAGFRAQQEAKGPEFGPWYDVFAPGGKPPAAGDLWGSPDHAGTLERIAASHADDFYTGQLAEKIAAFARETGGVMTVDDLATHIARWVDPIHTAYRDHEVWEIPPNGQGLTALLALNILENEDLSRRSRETAEVYHLQIEAMKLAFADAFRYIADPEVVPVPIDELLSKGYAAKRRKLIGDSAAVYKPGKPKSGDTVYLCAADKDGMMISYIQSNRSGFGSGVVVPGTGIALHNRGWDFVLEPGHPNVVAPGKRPYHTIIPGFLTQGGQPCGPFGIMGGLMQPQAHLQVMQHTIDWGLNPQAALDGPRWMVVDGLDVDVEASVSPEIVEGLRSRGHRVSVKTEAIPFGRGQFIRRLPNGALVAGSEPRADGLAAAY